MAERLEIANIVVADAEAAARRYASIFGWRVVRRTSSIAWGTTVLVGTDAFHIAVHSMPPLRKRDPAPRFPGQAKLVRVTVENLAEVRARVAVAGGTVFAFTGCAAADCFGFRDEDGVGFDVVSRLKAAA